MNLLKNICNKKDKAVVFIEPGGIGDYHFNIPFFKYIKQSAQFQDYKILFVCKASHIDFVLVNCIDYFDEIIPCNYDDFLKSKYYKKYLLEKIHKYSIEILINLRSIIIDTDKDYVPRRQLVKCIKSKKKIADIIKICDNKKFELKAYKYYNQLIFTHTVGLKFELERKHYLYKQLLGIDIPFIKSIDLTENQLNNILSSNNALIALSIESSSKKRMLPADKWVQIIQYILNKNNNTQILFIGSNKIKPTISTIINRLQNNNCHNLCGKTSVTMLPFLLEKCNLLLSVETGTVHIAHSVGCKTICLSNGSYYKRFHPYEDEIVNYIYSPSFIEKYSNSDDSYKFEAWCGGQDWSVDEIPLTDIYNAIDKSYKEINN